MTDDAFIERIERLAKYLRREIPTEFEDKRLMHLVSIELLMAANWMKQVRFASTETTGEES